MTEFKLAATMQIPVKDARAIIDKYFAVVPGVKMFLDSLGKVGKLRGYIKTAPPYGRIRWFPEWEYAVNNPNDSKSFATLSSIERASKNTPIQGTNADILKAVLAKLLRIIHENNYDIYIILAVYDEVRCEVPDELAEDWKHIMQEVMVKEAEKVLTKVPISVDCKITESWEK